MRSRSGEIPQQLSPLASNLTLPQRLSGAPPRAVPAGARADAGHPSRRTPVAWRMRKTLVSLLAAARRRARCCVLPIPRPAHEPASLRRSEGHEPRSPADLPLHDQLPALQPHGDRAWSRTRTSTTRTSTSTSRTCSTRSSTPSTWSSRSKFLSKYDTDVFRRLASSTDARLKYLIYKTNADFLLVSIGIFDNPAAAEAHRAQAPAERRGLHRARQDLLPLRLHLQPADAPQERGRLRGAREAVGGLRQVPARSCRTCAASTST